MLNVMSSYATDAKSIYTQTQKKCITPDSLVYTLLQKKGNFENVAFLLRKSVVGYSRISISHKISLLFRIPYWPISALIFSSAHFKKILTCWSLCRSRMREIDK